MKNSAFLLKIFSLCVFSFLQLHCFSAFSQVDKRKIPHVLVCEVFDAMKREQIKNAEVVIMRTDGTIEKTLKTDNFGKIRAEVPDGHLYIVYAFHPKYFASEKKEYSTITTLPGITDFRLFLKPVSVGTLIAFQLNYAPNDDKIDESNAHEAEQIFTFLSENLNLAVELSVHTDSRGAADYNLDLTQRRAENLKTYLTEKGILPHRIVPKGYGETRPLNQCADNVKCSNEEHLINRRVELLVLAVW
jgi:outer membrane protein OmpA-like peptidoglycan-associated protein